MATIKLNADGRVLVSDGENGAVRVKCECCDSVELCCVYPASCGVAPESITFYGTTLTGSGTTFGDSFNGVALEGGAWAVYRNGSRSTRECLGLALPGQFFEDEEIEPSVAADLPTTMSLSFTWTVPDPPGPGMVFLVTGTLAFGGQGTFVEDDTEFGQCVWSGGREIVPPSQSFDEGFRLYFNKASCRWELHDGPGALNPPYNAGLLAYRDDPNPIGAYVPDPVSLFGSLSNVVIS